LVQSRALWTTGSQAGAWEPEDKLKKLLQII
jgi:hypothetical protein